MTKKKKILITLIVGIAIAIGVALYMFNKPARDVQSTDTDFTFNSSEIVKEYLTDVNKANQKYLDENGNSKVLEISGTVAQIDEDFNKNKVILLKSAEDKAGVSATFMPETNANASKVKVGDNVTIKGVIQSGASYDADLELYENVILNKSDIVNK